MTTQLAKRPAEPTAREDGSMSLILRLTSILLCICSLITADYQSVVAIQYHIVLGHRRYYYLRVTACQTISLGDNRIHTMLMVACDDHWWIINTLGGLVE